MIRNDFHGHINGAGFTESFLSQFLSLLDDRPDKISIIIGRNVLNKRHNAFKPHSGINARLGQRCHFSRGIPVKLHKDQIPDFKIAVTFTTHGAIRLATSILFAAVDKNFRAGTAGPGIAHGPEVVFFTKSHDPLLGQADVLGPQLVGLIVIKVNGTVQFVSRQPITVG